MSKSYHSGLTDLNMQLHAETDAAIRVSDDGDDEKAVWLPKSQIEYEQVKAREGIVKVTLPEWLAQKKGLI